MVKKLLLATLLVNIAIGLFPTPAFAQDTVCGNRYSTIVNPVRGRGVWPDPSISHIQQQYQILANFNLPATWLLQYDALVDKEIQASTANFTKNQELGVMVEVTEKLTNDAHVLYPVQTPWYFPNAVFLSGYTQSDRRTLIDTLFATFHKIYGFYPKAIGAWWIDSYSLQYMKEKYHITSAMIVADQKSTDRYGVWGQWWGVPYFPSKANILTPAATQKIKQDVVIIQWAQRDLVQAYGSGTSSLYSVQANDYVQVGKDIKYFQDLVNTYLSCQNKVGQVTAGLETGMESVGSLPEFEKQVSFIALSPHIKSVTMSDFAASYNTLFPDISEPMQLSNNQTTWFLSQQQRRNDLLNDAITYNPSVSFSDYFVPDKDTFLNRVLPTQTTQKDTAWFPWYLLVFFATGIYAYRRKEGRSWIASSLFIVAAFGLLLRSHSHYGWQIFYGPQVPNLPLTQVFVTTAGFGMCWLLRKWNKYVLWTLPLSFGLDPILSSLRYTNLQNSIYLGFATNALQLIGLKVTNHMPSLLWQHQFSQVQANALLRFDFTKIWEHAWYALIAYPAIHIVTAIVLALILKITPLRLKQAIILLFTILLLWDILWILNSNPRMVVPL